jgi:Tol biopolymer transport system component
VQFFLKVLVHHVNHPVAKSPKGKQENEENEDKSFSPDGKRLYFSSKRPTESNPNGRDWNIWYVERTNSGWSEPKKVGEPVNGPRNDSNPAVAADGTLYFASDRDGAAGYFQIYQARLTNGHYEQPEKLGPEINSGEAEINPYISPDQKALIFASFTRKDTLARVGIHTREPTSTSERIATTAGRRLAI